MQTAGPGSSFQGPQHTAEGAQVLQEAALSGMSLELGTPAS